MSASGAARAGRRLSEELAERCDMTIASMSGVDQRAVGSVRELDVRCTVPWPLRRAAPRYRTLFYSSNIPALIANGDYDLVHLHNPLPALEMARIAAACRRRNVPYVVSTHGFNEIAEAETLHRLGLAQRLIWRNCVIRPVSRVMRGAAHVFALSQADIPIVQRFGYTGRFTIVPNGVQLPTEASEAEDQVILDRLQIPARDSCPGLACLFLGNHSPNKGVPVLLEAFRQLQCPYLLMVGGEKRPDIAYPTQRTQDRPDQQVIVTGRLTDDEVGALFRRADLFVFPTRADTFPLVVLEAMAHGRPVLSTTVGGIPHQVEPDCGVLVPPGDAGAVARAVAQFAADPATRQAMGQRARARVRSDFTWDAAAARAFDGYREVLRDHAPAQLRMSAKATGMYPVGEKT